MEIVQKKQEPKKKTKVWFEKNLPKAETGVQNRVFLQRRYAQQGIVMSDQLQHYERKLAYETDSWDVKIALEGNEKIIVIDARSPQAYATEHIPGAVNIPHRQMNPESTASLDKAALVVTYCDGIGCNASTKGALAMTKLGFRVKELMGGLDWWKRDGHPTSSGAASGAESSASCGCA